MYNAWKPKDKPKSINTFGQKSGSGINNFFSQSPKDFRAFSAPTKAIVDSAKSDWSKYSDFDWGKYYNDLAKSIPRGYLGNNSYKPLNVYNLQDSYNKIIRKTPITPYQKPTLEEILSKTMPKNAVDSVLNKPIQYNTREEYNKSLLGQTMPVGLSNFIENTADAATFGMSNKLLKRPSGAIIPKDQQTFGEKAAGFGGMVAGSLVPGVGMYQAGISGLSKLAPKFIPKTLGQKMATEAGLGAVTGAGYQTVAELADALQDTRYDGSQTMGQRLGNIGIATGFGGVLGGVAPAIVPAAKAIPRVPTAISEAIKAARNTPSTALNAGFGRQGQNAYDAFVNTLRQSPDGAGGGTPKTTSNDVDTALQYRGLTAPAETKLVDILTSGDLQSILNSSGQISPSKVSTLLFGSNTKLAATQKVLESLTEANFLSKGNGVYAISPTVVNTPPKVKPVVQTATTATRRKDIIDKINNPNYKITDAELEAVAKTEGKTLEALLAELGASPTNILTRRLKEQGYFPDLEIPKAQPVETPTTTTQAQAPKTVFQKEYEQAVAFAQKSGRVPTLKELNNIGIFDDNANAIIKRITDENLFPTKATTSTLDENVTKPKREVLTQEDIDTLLETKPNTSTLDENVTKPKREVLTQEDIDTLLETKPNTSTLDEATPTTPVEEVPIWQTPRMKEQAKKAADKLLGRNENVTIDKLMAELNIKDRTVASNLRKELIADGVIDGFGRPKVKPTKDATTPVEETTPVTPEEVAAKLDESAQAGSAVDTPKQKPKTTTTLLPEKIEEYATIVADSAEKNVSMASIKRVLADNWSKIPKSAREQIIQQANALRASRVQPPSDTSLVDDILESVANSEARRTKPTAIEEPTPATTVEEPTVTTSRIDEEAPFSDPIDEELPFNDPIVDDTVAPNQNKLFEDWKNLSNKRKALVAGVGGGTLLGGFAGAMSLSNILPTPGDSFKQNQAATDASKAIADNQKTKDQVNQNVNDTVTKDFQEEQGDMFNSYNQQDEMLNAELAMLESGKTPYAGGGSIMDANAMSELQKLYQPVQNDEELMNSLASQIKDEYGRLMGGYDSRISGLKGLQSGDIGNLQKSQDNARRRLDDNMFQRYMQTQENMNARGLLSSGLMADATTKTDMARKDAMADLESATQEQIGQVNRYYAPLLNSIMAERQNVSPDAMLRDATERAQALRSNQAQMATSYQQLMNQMKSSDRDYEMRLQEFNKKYADDTRAKVDSGRVKEQYKFYSDQADKATKQANSLEKSLKGMSDERKKIAQDQIAKLEVLAENSRNVAEQIMLRQTPIDEAQAKALFETSTGAGGGLKNLTLAQAKQDKFEGVDLPELQKYVNSGVGGLQEIGTNNWMNVSEAAKRILQSGMNPIISPQNILDYQKYANMKSPKPNIFGNVRPYDQRVNIAKEFMKLYNDPNYKGRFSTPE